MKKTEAIEIAKKYFGDLFGNPKNLGLDVYEIIDKNSFWFVSLVIIDETKVEPSQLRCMIDKTSSEVMKEVPFRSMEDQLFAFKLGFRECQVDLKILSIDNLKDTIELLLGLRLSYVIPELENGVIWKIGKTFSVDEIKGRLEKLPCVFKNQTFKIKWNLGSFENIIKSKAFTFELSTSKKEYPRVYGELIDKDELLS
ncbi:MAG: hypothetical protein AB8F94_15315 [Saprospiraceae bacterium]